MKWLLLAIVLLGGCRRPGIVPQKAAVADSLAPDQVVWGMRMYMVRNGVRVSLVEADTAFINQQTNITNMLGVRITFFDSLTGRTTSTVTSKTGVYDMRNESLDARGSVVALTNENKTLRTEHLVYDKVQNQIHSDSAFTVVSPTEHMSGNAFEADPSFKTVTVVKPRAREKAASAKRPPTQPKVPK